MEDIRNLIGWLEIEKLKAKHQADWLIDTKQCDAVIDPWLDKMKHLSEVIDTAKLLIN